MHFRDLLIIVIAASAIFLSSCLPIRVNLHEDGSLTVSLVASEDEIEPYLIGAPLLPDNFEIGYSPVGIPIRIAVDSKGKVLVSASASIVTPIGVFDITASKNITPQNDKRLLNIQIDGKVYVYELENKDFRLEFYNNNQYYRLLTFQQRSNGNIELMLETIR